jgi:hypothetical protein
LGECKEGRKELDSSEERRADPGYQRRKKLGIETRKPQIVVGKLNLKSSS